MSTSNNSKVVITVLLGLGFGAVTSAQGQERERREPPTFDQLLEKMDSSKDGKLSVAEVKGSLKKRFATVDTDEDGYITREEFENAPKPKKGKRENT